MTDTRESTRPGESAPSVVQMSGISKAFSGVQVLRDVDFEVRRGEIHALAGGNGAGKSTLMKILQGVYTRDTGTISLDGLQVTLGTIHDARRAGIGMVFQEFSLVPTLTVAQNIFLTNEPRGRLGMLDDREAVRRAREIFDRMQVEVDPRARVGDLGTAYWQLTEIAKALSQDARVLIMDEPTASLARHEADTLFELAGRLKADGVSIIYISHRMDEVYRLADRITILRDGRWHMTEKLSDVTPDQIVEGIVGKKLDAAMTVAAGSVPPDGPVMLEARGISSGRVVRDISFELRAGEIVGLAGLMGSGRTELARVLFGIDALDSGEILVKGRPADLSSTRSAIRSGIALIPEDRREQGLVLDHSVRDNLLLPLLDRVRQGPLLSDRRGKALAASLIGRFSVKAANPSRPIRLLSGGNQQKVVIAKWLGTEPDVLILDEPTAGVDIGTKNEILGVIRALADSGKGVLLISSEYSELLAVGDRILVLREGSIVDDLMRADIPDEEHLQLSVQGVTT